MKRGEIWTAEGYAGKPRPVVIVQDGRFDSTRSVTICGFTSTEIEASLFRVAIAPNTENRLQGASWLVADKLVTVPREKLGRRIGRFAQRRRVTAQSCDHDLLGVGWRMMLLFPVPRPEEVQRFVLQHKWC